jgi:hypothetical protein
MERIDLMKSGKLMQFGKNVFKREEFYLLEYNIL